MTKPATLSVVVPCSNFRDFAASGTYLTFLDGDDWLAGGCLPQMVDAIERELQAALVGTDEHRVRTLRRERGGMKDVVAV